MAKIILTKKARTEAFDKDAIDRFTVDDPNYVDHTIIQPDGSDAQAIVKIVKMPGQAHQFKVVGWHSNFADPVTLWSGPFLGAVHEYEEFTETDPAEALVTIRAVSA